MNAHAADLLTDLSNDFTQLLDVTEGRDVVIYAGEGPQTKELLAHSLILRVRSSYFRKLLADEWDQKSGKQAVVIKPKIAPRIFQIILKFLYTGAVDLEQLEGPEILKLFMAAQELQLNRLINYVQTYLVEEETEWLREDPVQILDLVLHNPACSGLRDYCLQAICQNPDFIFGVEMFLSIEEDMLILLLQRDDLAIEEIEVFDHLLRWGVAQNASMNKDSSKWADTDYAQLEETLHQCIPLIRWFQIPPSDFSRRVRPHKRLLPAVLYEDILSYHLDPETDTESTVLPARLPVFDSTTIDAQIAALFASWIDCKSKEASYKVQRNPYDFRLLFRASRDGFAHTAFHRRCDSKKATVVIAKVADSSVIVGGYNPIDWDIIGYRNARTSFIFQIDRDHGLDSAKISRVSNPGNEAVYCEANKLPMFGAGPDLALSTNKTWSSKQQSYPAIFASSGSRIEDYEVFQVTRRPDRPDLLPQRKNSNVSNRSIQSNSSSDLSVGNDSPKKITKFFRLH